MKTKAFISILVLLLLGAVGQFHANAQTGEQSARGTYQFSFDDGYTKYVEFDARGPGDGSAVGQMFLSDEAPYFVKDVDGEGQREESYKGFYIKAQFDSLVVNKNQAVMAGTVSDSSVSSLVGQKVLLTVEDNGDNSREPDKLTWGLYKPLERSWTPSDAERKEDEGVGLRWWATDSERKDDVGYAMPRDEAINTSSFPVSSYSFVESDRVAGDILIQP
ncbi:MAG TPA: hypothetical protein VJS44_03780 [Pyrinomonadaceae bacterium]|nr:hypothetical protein [Pyrinomonadaceae bacterium]